MGFFPHCGVHRTNLTTLHILNYNILWYAQNTQNNLRKGITYKINQQIKFTSKYLHLNSVFEQQQALTPGSKLSNVQCKI